ncbi:MAG: 5-methyltetrahydrofolate--homocysteine methyltransferase [Deltaproteobacteria bacterium HGW-Deltaproteobacteria-17]|nr:MAG: 5-methyltetrahydrofolate--homocysteine methyltransferase [Deltaproteobacteria bacterium HGW-Deltaproteobacteria-17]
MTKKQRINSLLKNKILILDGAMGTELQQRGMPPGVCPEAWIIEHPEIVQEIHRAYALAGADMVYTCTFGANRLKLGEYGIENVREVNRTIARLTRAAVGKQTFIAGDIGPTGRFVEPSGDLAFEEAVAVFKEQVLGLLEGGVDLFVIETMMDIQEARAALIAVKECSDCFALVTMTYEPDGRTLGGTDPVTALITLQSLGADAVGCNCSTGPDAMLPFIRAMKPYATVPLAAKPNAGIPRLAGGKTVFEMSAAAFGAFGERFAQAGVNLIGGCCGTTPAHIAALRQAMAMQKPLAPLKRSIAALSSSRRHQILESNKPLCVVGERLNPTGKEALQQELLAGSMNLVRQIARRQEQQGADLLDVNVGVPGIDEVKTIRQIIGLLATHSDLPLVIDSPKVETIEAALRLYPGRALINSISGEKDKCRKLLSLAAKYGAMFILLPLADGEIPETAEKRKAVIRDVSRQARHYGLTKDDFVVDGLVMTAASNPQAALETLKTVRWCAEKLQCRTILGLSNVSFGMPERRWVDAAFLAMAQAAGLTMAIANPGSEELLHIKRAGDVLLLKDRDAAAYIRHFTHQPQQPATAAALSPGQKVREAILDGNREGIIALVEAALTAGLEVGSLVDEVMVPAIVHVGELFDKKICFLPQLIASAEAMRLGVSHLEPRLYHPAAARSHKGAVVLATVRGDIHDIGKNIVALMLKNHGYQIIDLGKDVPVEAVIAAVKQHRADVVGLSALMTTTMIQMKKVIEAAAAEGLPARFILGGAVVTRAYAESLGAAYAKDGVAAVRVVEKLMTQVKNPAHRAGLLNG